MSPESETVGGHADLTIEGHLRRNNPGQIMPDGRTFMHDSPESGGVIEMYSLSCNVPVNAPNPSKANQVTQGEIVGVLYDGACCVEFLSADSLKKTRALFPFSYLLKMNPQLRLSKGFLSRRRALFALFSGIAGAALGMTGGTCVDWCQTACMDRAIADARQKEAPKTVMDQLYDQRDQHLAETTKRLARDTSIGAIGGIIIGRLLKMWNDWLLLQGARRDYGNEAGHAVTQKKTEQ